MKLQTILLLILYLPVSFYLGAQEINNLELPLGTEVGKENELGHVMKIGSGPVAMILIADAGFGWSIYKDFMQRNKKEYTIYAVTLAGSDKTRPSPMPEPGVSYSDHSWLEGAQKGILSLIDKEKLLKPVVIGNLIISTSVVLHLALKYPDKIGKVIVLGGMPRASWPSPKNPPQPVSFEERGPGIDRYVAPKVYKMMTREAWSRNLYQSIQYSNDSVKGRQLFETAASASMPVMIRYLCEFYTTDIALDFDKIKVPVLVLIPGFDEKYLREHAPFRDEEYFQRGWEKANSNKLIQQEIVENARIFVWYDQPKVVDEHIKAFVKK